MQRSRLYADLLVAFASRGLFSGFAMFHMTCDDLNELAQTERQMGCNPELADQHDHVARRVNCQDPNDVADVQTSRVSARAVPSAWRSVTW